MTNDDLTTALRDRVRNEHPDVDHLIRVSTRTGTRLRRRRTIGVSIAGVAAGVAVIGIVGASLGGSGGTTGSEPGFATQPTPSASATPSPDAGPRLIDLDRSHADELREMPVVVAGSLKGWRIGGAADDKLPASKGDYFVSINVRPKADLDAWSGGDVDHPASQVVHVGRNYFVTAQPADGVPPAVVDELVAALRYQPRWQQ